MSFATLIRWIIVVGAVALPWYLVGAWLGILCGLFAVAITTPPRIDPKLLSAQSALLERLPDHSHIATDDGGTTVYVPLRAEVPRLGSLSAGPGGIESGDPAFDAAVNLVASPHDWIPLLSKPVRAALQAMMPAEYDRDRHALVFRAISVREHEALPAQLERAAQLIEVLDAVAEQDRLELLRSRLAESDVPAERLAIFKVFWHADDDSARALAATLPDAAIRYFVATASTPPDRDTIAAIAFDDAVDGGTRTQASLRWLGLAHGIYRLDADGARRLGELDGVLERLLPAWAAGAPHSKKAIELLGQFGRPEHASIIGSQRAGPFGKAADRAMELMLLRFPALEQGGQLAISVVADGQLGLVDANGEDESEG